MSLYDILLEIQYIIRTGLLIQYARIHTLHYMYINTVLVIIQCGFIVLPVIT